MAVFKKVPGSEDEGAVQKSELWTSSVEIMGTAIPVWGLLIGIGLLAFLLFIFGMWERDPKSKDIEEFRPEHRGD